nr:glycosyltransferase family 2 protein [Brevibacillus sp. SYP-B805]
MKQSRVRREVGQIRERHDTGIELVKTSSFICDEDKVLAQNPYNLSVIISVSNEEGTIGELLASVKSLQPKEVIVVENGSTDKTLEICLQHEVTCFSYPYRLGHDVGRAIGAREATGEVFLFLDGDIVFQPQDLLPFVAACYQQVDIALNDVNPFYTKASMIDAVSLAKRFLNRVLRHGSLKYASLTAIPHAMKRRAAEIIGYANLAIPPKAQAMAALAGLTIENVHAVNVFSTNKIRSYNSSNTNVVEDMILGDHVEALQWVQATMGNRCFFADMIRQREMIDHAISQHGSFHEGYEC